VHVKLWKFILCSVKKCKCKKQIHLYDFMELGKNNVKNVIGVGVMGFHKFLVVG
jgi:hypothetical protein